MLIVGISAKKRRGKDTAAQVILDTLGSLAARVAFADLLKREIANGCSVTLKQIEDNKDFFRPILQWWGTDLRRQFQNKPNYWIDTLDQYIDENCQGKKLVVIPDVRFPNEYDYVRARSGHMLRIIRNMIDDSHSFHVSETALDHHEFDTVINNNGTLEEFQHAVRKLTCDVLMRRL